MLFFYSNETKGFYVEEIHGERIPSDAVLLQEGQHERAMTWQAAGGVIVGVTANGEMNLQAARPPTLSEITLQKRLVVQAHLDSQAVVFGYEDIAAAISYADEPIVPKFQLEGLAFRAWRSLVWEKFAEVMADAHSIADIPSDAGIIAALPAFTPPGA